MFRILVVLMLTGTASCAGDHGVYSIPGHIIHSDAIGDDFTIRFRRSASFDSTRPYTLILMADASLGLGQYALGTDSNHRATLPPNSVLVAIGHTGNTHDERPRDFIPALEKDRKKSFGHADRFYDFLRKDILPFVQSKLPSPARKVFIGHSFSGLFALYLSLKDQQLFDTYFAISPSVWANRHYLMELEAQYAASHKNLPARIYLYAGKLEFFNKVLYSTRRFYRTITARKYPSLNISLEEIGGTNHFSIRWPAIDRIMATL